MTTDIVESPPIVQLEPYEIRQVNEIADVRTNAKENRETLVGVEESLRETSETSEKVKEKVNEIHTTGLAGELAFAKFYGIEFPYGTEGELDGGYDFVLELDNGDWLTVDVKTTEHWDGELIRPHYNPAKADLYYLTNYDTDTNRVRLKGMIAGEIFRDAPVKYGYEIPCHVYKSDNLVPVLHPDDVTVIEPHRYEDREKVTA